MAEKKGILFVLSGFSGAGKGTIMRTFFEKYRGFALSISATTRLPRAGEEHGIDYFFITEAEFEEIIAKDGLIEYTRYRNNYYGTPKQFVMDKLNAGVDVFLEIEVDGCSKVKKLFPDAVTIFVTTPGAEELYRRLKSRGTDTDEEIMGRLARAAEEIRFIPEYDYLLVNDDLDECVDALYDLTEAEKARPSRNEDTVSAFAAELDTLLKGE